MPKTSPQGETPLDIIVQKPLLSSSTFSLSWPQEGNAPAIVQIPSAPAAVADFHTADTTAAVNPFFDSLPMPDFSHGLPDTSPSTIPSEAEHLAVAKRSRPPLPIARTFSTPPPNQLKHLRHPSRNNVVEQTPVSAPVSVVASQHALPIHPPANPQISELALELADSVQMVIQTLIHISPPHLLDPAKEQLAGCTLQLPTPSIAALLTTMKNLNYMSANLSELSTPDKSPGALAAVSEESSTINAIQMDPLNEGAEIVSTRPISVILDDFDIGEVLQSVGDALSGMAAEAGVDLVLFHADVGMKHVNVKGDECGISYALCHVIRQLILCSSRGDEIEVGLFISSPSRALREVSSFEDPPLDDDPLMCTLEIVHKFGPTASPAESQEFVTIERPKPEFSATILHNLLKHVRATLLHNDPPKDDANPSKPPTFRALEFSVLLSPGPPISNAPVFSEQDARARESFLEQKIQPEPTLDELNKFILADPAKGEPFIRGKKAIFHSSEKSSFAHHLTSYLTAWGLDVSHIAPVAPQHATGATGSDEEATPPLSESTTRTLTEADSKSVRSNSPRDSPLSEAPSSKAHHTADEDLMSDAEAINTTDMAGTSFIIIDDDVNVLRRRLAQIRRLTEKRLLPTRFPANLRIKRPGLQHRPRSSPSIRLAATLNAAGEDSNSDADDMEPKRPEFDPTKVVVVHFTSLTNYRGVQDIIQAALYTTNISEFGATYSLRDIVPDVLVIPKPAGPRRFLTALYTAVTKPTVDPFFAPIATTPMSPTGHHRIGPWGPNSKQSPKQITPGEVGSNGSGSRLLAARHNSSGSAASSGSGRLPTLSGDRASPGEHPTASGHGVPASYSGLSSQHPAYPPSPLAHEGVEYFSIENAPISSSAGILVHSPDGRPAGIFFQPQQGKDKKGRKSTGEKADLRSTPGRASRAGSSSDYSQLNLDAVLASVAPGTPNNNRVPPSDGDTYVIAGGPVPTARPSPGAPAPVAPPWRKPTGNGEDPGRPPLLRIPSSRMVAAVPTPRHPPRRASASVSPREKQQWARGDDSRSETTERQRVASRDREYEDTASELPPGIPAVPPYVPDPVTSRFRPQRRRQDDFPYEEPEDNSKPVEPIIPPINVLIVEDNPINQTILCTFMKRKKINYGTAKNGQEAIERWRTGNFHLILMDIQMPVMDGIQATQKIRAMEKERNIGIFPSTPPSDSSQSGKAVAVPSTPYRSAVIIVALTASSLKSDRVEALAAGCNDFLTKPVSMTWLNTKIIEWGSIKVLEMFQDPATARMFAGQNAKSKSIASQLKLPPSRKGSPAPDLPDLPVYKKPDALEVPAPEARTDQAVVQDIAEELVPVSPSATVTSHEREVSGEDALRQHLDAVALQEAKRRDSTENGRPVILGEGALSSEGSSTSIESVIHGIPSIAEQTTETTAIDEPRAPAIPMAPPSAPPELSIDTSADRRP